MYVLRTLLRDNDTKKRNKSHTIQSYDFDNSTFLLCSTVLHFLRKTQKTTLLFKMHFRFFFVVVMWNCKVVNKLSLSVNLARYSVTSTLNLVPPFMHANFIYLSWYLDKLGNIPCLLWLASILHHVEYRCLDHHHFQAKIYIEQKELFC